MKEIAVVEMVIVVKAIAKVNICIRRSGLVHNSAPRDFISWKGRRRRLEPIVEGRSKVVDYFSYQVWSSKVITRRTAVSPLNKNR